MMPRLALVLYISFAVTLVLASLVMHFFGFSTRKHLLKQMGAALVWPILLFSIHGRMLLLSIFKETQQENP